jgi:hypothetical protein
VSSTSARPTKSSRKLVPEDSVAADVASSLPRDAQDASDRNGRVSACGVERVVGRRAGVCLWTAGLGLGALVGAEIEGVEVMAGVETRRELSGALTVVVAATGLRAPGAGSGRIDGWAGGRAG